jgi:MFS family permease
MWLTLLLLCGPIGTLIGYLLGGALVGRGLDWRYAFYIQTSCLIPVLLSIIFTPVKYLDLENRDMQITPPIPTELVSPPANPRASF